MGGRSKALLEIGGGETFLTRIIGAFRAAGVTSIAVVGTTPTPGTVDKRQRVLQAAAALFDAQGYERTTIDQIAAALRQLAAAGLIVRE